MLLEDIRKTAERLTGLARPSARQAQARVHDRKPQTWRFKDDGLTPNNRLGPRSGIAAWWT